MKPSGVQLASPILPPRLADAQQLGRRLVLVGREHHAEGRDAPTSKLASGNGSASASASRNSTFSRFGRGALAAAFEQRRHVIGRGHVAPAARRRERRVAVAGRDIEHLAAGAQVERFAQLLADDLQRGADDGIVARGPGALLALP